MCTPPFRRPFSGRKRWVGDDSFWNQVALLHDSKIPDVVGGGGVTRVVTGAAACAASGTGAACGSACAWSGGDGCGESCACRQPAWLHQIRQKRSWMRRPFLLKRAIFGAVEAGGQSVSTVGVLQTAHAWSALLASQAAMALRSNRW